MIRLGATSREVERWISLIRFSAHICRLSVGLGWTTPSLTTAEKACLADLCRQARLGSILTEKKKDSDVTRAERLDHAKAQGKLGWTELIDAMKSRFGPSAFLNYNVELSKIRQRGSILDYQEHFEELSNMVRGWSIKALEGAFIGGLKDEIRIEVHAAKPRSLPVCFEVARMVKEKHRRLCAFNRIGNTTDKNMKPPGLRPEPPSAPTFNMKPSPASKQVIKRLTPEQIKDK
ncbi:hypothetical protein EJ110_NYTH53738 [Nymphaea thermarum]|nr:hypothetical protein EJ110_NYTH53738 [Nymphaea thermarum]